MATNPNINTADVVVTTTADGTYTADRDLYGVQMDRTKSELIAELIDRLPETPRTKLRKLTKEQAAGMLADFATAARINEASAAAIEAATPKPKAKSVPLAERRNEMPHPDAVEAVANWGCASCGAAAGSNCTAKTGKPTNHVHSDRIKSLDLARKYETPIDPALVQPAAKKSAARRSLTAVK